MQTYDLVKAALKEKNPALYKELTASKKLNEFVRERADEIRSATVALTMDISAKDRAAGAYGPTWG